MRSIGVVPLACALGFAPGAAAPMHPIDQPLAYVEVVIAPGSVVYQVILNFAFVDAVLPRDGIDRRVRPSDAELERLPGTLQELFAAAVPVEIDGARVAPRLEGFTATHPRDDLIPMLPPEVIRALSQVSFRLVHASETPTDTVRLAWGLHPRHALMEGPGSPMIASPIKAVLRVDDHEELVVFREGEPPVEWQRGRGVVASADPRDGRLQSTAMAATEMTPHPAPTWPSHLLLAAGGAVLLVVLVGIRLGRERLLRAGAPLILMLLFACAPEVPPSAAPLPGAPGVVDVEAWSVRVAPAGGHFPLNTLCTAEVAVSARPDAVLPSSLRVDADMPEHRHGINTRPEATPIGPGRWRVEGLLFHMPGDWELFVDLVTERGVVRAVLPFHLPEEREGDGEHCCEEARR